MLKEESNCKSETSLIALASPTLFLLALSLWLAETPLRSLCRKPRGFTGSTACVLVLNLTYSALANIHCVMNMPTSGRQKLRKITAGLVFHWASMGNLCYKPKDALVHPACWKLSDTSRCICRDPQDSQQRCSLKGESTHRGSTFWYKLG